jgi:hypothetical protein
MIAIPSTPRFDHRLGARSVGASARVAGNNPMINSGRTGAGTAAR